MKYVLKMAFRNIGRNKRRTMLSSVAISIAVMVIVFMSGYVGGITDSMFDSMTNIETGHIEIVHPEFREKADMMPLEYMVDGFNGEGYKQMLPILESVEGVEVIAPRIKFGVLLSHKGRNQSALGLGISSKAESRITSFDKIMVEGQYFGDDENEKSIIIGKALADKLGINLADNLTILARTAYDSLRGMTFRVTGMFRYGISALDSKLFYVPIGAAARLLEMGNGVSQLILMVDKPENAEKLADEIEGKFLNAGKMSALPEDGGEFPYKIVPWQKQGGFLSMFKSALLMYKGIFLGLLLLASTVIVNTTMMVIYERMKEIGTIGALGMTGGQIVLLFVIEAVIVSAIGSFMGIVVGGGLDFYFHKVGINLQALSGGSVDMQVTDIIYPRFDLYLLVWSFSFGVVVASITAYFPSRRAAKIEPVEALRSI